MPVVVNAVPSGTDAPGAMATTGACVTGFSTVTDRVPVPEGTAFTTTGTASDQDGDALTATVDYGSGPQPLALAANGSFTLSRVYAEDGVRPVVVAVSDGTRTTSATVTATVTNAVPVVAAPTGPASAGTGAPVTVQATFTDGGVQDLHTVSYSWGDGTTSTGSVSETPGSGTVSAAHAYATPGSYTVTVTVTDDDGGAASRTFGPVAVTSGDRALGQGSGTITSPKRSSTYVPTKAGATTFTFHAGTRGTPYGDAAVTFKVGKIAFTGTSVSSAAVSGSLLTMTVAGTQSGRPGYTLTVTARDGGPGRPDYVRFRLFQGTRLVYDSQPGQSAGAAPTAKVRDGRVEVYR